MTGWELKAQASPLSPGWQVRTPRHLQHPLIFPRLTGDGESVCKMQETSAAAGFTAPPDRGKCWQGVRQVWFVII